MNRTTSIDTLYPQCPIRNVLSRLGDKWSLLVLYTLSRDGEEGVMRFGGMLRAIPDISQKMLTVTLRTLEEDGFVARRVYPEVPPRVEYSLTPRALSLLPLVDRLVEWAAENMDGILADRRRTTGMPNKKDA